MAAGGSKQRAPLPARVRLQGAGGLQAQGVLSDRPEGQLGDGGGAEKPADLRSGLGGLHAGEYVRGPLSQRQHPQCAHRQNGSRVHRSEEHTSELQSRQYLVCRLLLEKKKNKKKQTRTKSTRTPIN